MCEGGRGGLNSCSPLRCLPVLCVVRIQSIFKGILRIADTRDNTMSVVKMHQATAALLGEARAVEVVEAGAAPVLAAEGEAPAPMTGSARMAAAKAKRAKEAAEAAEPTPGEKVRAVITQHLLPALKGPGYRAKGEAGVSPKAGGGGSGGGKGAMWGGGWKQLKMVQKLQGDFEGADGGASSHGGATTGAGVAPVGDGGGLAPKSAKSANWRKMNVAKKVVTLGAGKARSHNV